MPTPTASRVSTVHFSLILGLVIGLPLFASAVEDTGYSIKKVNHELIDNSGQTDNAIGDYRDKARYQKEIDGSGKFSGVRFHIQWRAPSSEIPNFMVKLETRGYDAGSRQESLQTFSETYPQTPNFSGWTVLDIKGESLQKLGKMLAWKVTLLQDGKSVAERKSFTWDSPTTASQKTTSNP